MNENAKAWVEALESGRFPQTTRVLHAVDGAGNDEGYCCLGVGAVLAVEAGVTSAQRQYGRNTVSYDGNDTALPDSVRSWLGLRTEIGGHNDTSLADLNDDRRMSFAQIAAVIRSEPPGLFE